MTQGPVQRLQRTDLDIAKLSAAEHGPLPPLAAAPIANKFASVLQSVRKPTAR